MDDPDITMEEYFQRMADKARRRDFSAIVYNDASTFCISNDITPVEFDENFETNHYIRLIMEYLVNISTKAGNLELKRRYLKNIVLTLNTSYPTRKIRRIRACTSPDNMKNSNSIRRIQNIIYAVFKIYSIPRFWKILNVVPTPRNS
ncbi:hypothetical protein Tco_0111773 [Tanacetum coccineum]